jgi:hypothetical protein
VKYKVKSNVFESAHCEFDGQTAVSYGWYTFARRLADDSWLFTSCNYSMQTERHICEVKGLLRGETIHYLYAPQGLQSPEFVRENILSKIAQLEEELLNKRNRAIELRKSRIVYFKEQLSIVQLWEVENV